MEDTVKELWAAHSYWLIPLCWMILSAVLNILFRKKTPEQWIEFTEKNPRAAALIRLCRSLGIDPHKALIAFKRFVDGKAQPTTPALKAADKVLDAVVDAVADESADDKKSEDKKSEDKKPTDKDKEQDK